MTLGIEAIIWYAVLADSIFANFAAWFFPNWYKKKFKKLHKLIPMNKVWCAFYFMSVLWIGYALARLSII